MSCDTKNENVNFRREIMSTFQVALLGMVDSTLRGVIVGWDISRIYARCYYDGKLRESEKEIASDIEAEIVASFPGHDVEVTAVQCNMPEAILLSNEDEVWVYRRREVTP